MYCIGRDQQQHLSTTQFTEVIAWDQKGDQTTTSKINNNADGFGDALTVANATTETQQDTMRDGSKEENKITVDNLMGTGRNKNLSKRLTRYINQHKDNDRTLSQKFTGDVLLIDSMLESGNLL